MLTFTTHDKCKFPVEYTEHNILNDWNILVGTIYERVLQLAVHDRKISNDKLDSVVIGQHQSRNMIIKR